MKLNTTPAPVFTHEGAPALQYSPIHQLRRTVLACLLWEDGFYESGEAIADRIRGLVPQCEPRDVGDLAVEARTVHRLRHVPLLLMRELARHPRLNGWPTVKVDLPKVIQRADELAEFLAIYWADGRQPLSAQVKRGLAEAFCNFDEYALAKYNRDSRVKLRDVLFIVHAKPRNAAQADLWRRLVAGELTPPDTWEVALSSGADKRETFERLLNEGKLGYLALLRNLRNMYDAGVDRQLVWRALRDGACRSKALPFRFIAAARAVPAWEQQIDEAMQIATGGMPRLPGKTCLLVDVSGSMSEKLSGKSDLRRIDAAAGLAVLIREIAAECVVCTFANEVKAVPPRRGMALVDAIGAPAGGTWLGKAVQAVRESLADPDRLIVITDEQSADAVGAPGCKGYMINVATSRNGVGYGDWTRINGFSESVVSFITAHEDLRPRS
jgi:hypothetical protein